MITAVLTVVLFGALVSGVAVIIADWPECAGDKEW